MNELHVKNGSIGSRFRCAIAVGLTSFASIAGDWNHAEAAWWPFPLSRKSADDSPSKSDSGFNGTIRKLLKEAKAQEELGNFDKAIALADRAAKVSESTSTFVKPAPDVSPNTTAHYARELRLKKAEQSLRQNQGKSNATTIGQKEPTDSGAKSSNKESDPPKPRNRFLTKTSDSMEKQKAKDTTPKSAFAVTQRRKSRSAAPKVTEELVARGNKSTEIPVVDSEAPTTNSKRKRATTTVNAATMADESSRDNPEQIVAASTPESTAPRVAPADENAKSQRLVAVDAVGVTPVESALLEDHQMPSRFDEGSMVLKLRRQYTSNILEAALGFGTAADSELAVQLETADSLTMAESEDGESNDQSILTVAAEEDPSSGWESLSNTDDESRPGNDQENEPVKKSTDAASGGDFPVNEVNNLRDRLISAASLEPGVVAPEVTKSTSENDEKSNSSNDEYTTSGGIRLRKRRPLVLEPEIKETSEAPVSNMRQPVIGHVSAIQWRSAKDLKSADSPETKTNAEFRSVHQPEDLRKSLRDISMTAYEASIVGNRASARRVQGSTGDNAVAPSNETNFALHEGSMNWNETDATSSTFAPLPPPDSDADGASLTSGKSSNSALSGSNVSDEFLRALDQSISDDDNSSEKSKFATGLKGSEKKLRISESATWTLLSALGFAALLAGICTFRASVRADDSNQTK